MNTSRTKEFFEKHGVVAIKADKTNTDHPEDIANLLSELGNYGHVLPFYAIYPADGGKPILLDGIVTQTKLLETLEQAVPKGADDPSARTAMKPSP